MLCIGVIGQDSTAVGCSNGRPIGGPLYGDVNFVAINADGKIVVSCLRQDNAVMDAQS